MNNFPRRKRKLKIKEYLGGYSNVLFEKDLLIEYGSIKYHIKLSRNSMEVRLDKQSLKNTLLIQPIVSNAIKIISLNRRKLNG